MGPEHLFDAELQYRPSIEPIAGPEGELIGSGDGTAEGGRRPLRARSGRRRSSMRSPRAPRLNASGQQKGSKRSKSSLRDHA